MDFMKTYLGRRRFIAAAGVTSASAALALEKFGGIMGPFFQRGVAMASDNSKASSSMKKYPYLLSPIKIGNKILKNRILHTPSPPHSLQGPENFPADSYRAHYSQIAKNAAVVTVVEHFGQYPKTYSQNDTGFAHYSDSSWEDIPPVYNYIEQLLEDIHCEGALVSVGKLQGSTVEEVVTKAKKWEEKGFDVVEVGERSWYSIKDVRADLEKLEAARKATNLIIEAVILPCTPGLSRGPAGWFVDGKPAAWISEGLPTSTDYEDAKGPELEELLEMVKMIDGLVDIIRMKDVGHCTNHPNSFTMEKEKPWMLRFAQAIKESGAKIITAPNGGFHDPDMNEEFIASGKTDMVAMATPLIADPEYVQKAYEGRAGDIVPCVMCHSCHGISRTKGPWFDTCTVNPKWGLSETKKRSMRPPLSVKKVAVIGGGPAGMKAALTAFERGHKVTLYEKDEALGGLMRHTDYTQWKWTYRDFKDYLVKQVKKTGIEVKLKTMATPGMIKSKGYDTVLAATGAEPVVSRIPGADNRNVFNIMEAYTNMKSMGKDVVIIGAGVFGTETGICLAKDGYKVTILTSDKQLIQEEAIGPHNMENQLDIAQNHPNISHFLEVFATKISDGKVFYKDSSGVEKYVKADSVVIHGGLKPRMDEAMTFSGSAGQVLFLGDCTGQAGTMQKTMRSAFFVASQV